MVIYTAITNNYDNLKEQPESTGTSLQYHAFTDRDMISKTWLIKECDTSFSSPRLNAKRHKILSHEYFRENEITLWIDGSIEIRSQALLLNMAHLYLSDADIAVFAHGERYCVYQEAAVCIHKRKDDPEVIRKQIFRYTQEGYPADNGLAECSILLRRQSKHVKEFNEHWWNEIVSGSIRDQISFPYSLSKSGIKVNYISGKVGDGSLFVRRRHM